MAWVAALLLLTATAGLWRIMLGPTTADRLLSVQLLGTTGISLLLVMAEWLQQPYWRDVALVLALLAAVITAALVQLLRRPAQPTPESGERDE